MLIKFTKMHGLGNDFVVIDGISQSVTITPKIAKKLGDRNFGIGCDQILIVESPSRPDVDFRYRIFNNNGQEVEQCGNGARCFAKFVHNRKLTGKSNILVETKNGIIKIRLLHDGLVQVDMGPPELEPNKIPFDADKQEILYKVPFEESQILLSAISMGNPHAVVVVDDTASASVKLMGEVISKNSMFPKEANVGFMQIINPSEINLRVYERGCGETLACGSGACAAVVAGQLQGLLETTVRVNLTGGSLFIEWAGNNHPVMMTGKAVTVFHGQIYI